MNGRISVAVGMVAVVALSAGQAAGLRGGLGRQRPRAQAPLSVPPLLQKAIDVQPTLRYTGTYTVEFTTGAKVPRHQEYIQRSGDWFRIDFPPDSPFAGQVIVENGKARLHYRPILNEIMQQPPRHDDAWERIKRLTKNRNVVLSSAPGEVVAGQKTEQIVVADRSGNVSIRLYIEPNTGLIMKRELFDMVGTRVGYFAFDKVNLSPHIDPSVFVIRRNGVRFVTPEIQLQRVSKRRGFTVHFLPPRSGFSLESAVYKDFVGIDGIVQIYLGEDKRLWLYVLKAPIDPVELRKGAGKNVHFFSFEMNGETIVLLGNFPDDTLRKLAPMVSGGTQPLRH